MQRNDFDDFILNLRYKYPDTNSKRLALIRFIQGIYVKTRGNKRITAGAMLLGADIIHKNSLSFLPQKMTIFGVKIKGSDLLDILNEQLNKEGYLDFRESIICLAEFYDYFKKNPDDCEDLFKSEEDKNNNNATFFADSKTLFDDFEEITSRLVDEHSEIIYQWLDKLFSADMLKQNISTVTSHYRKLKKHTHDVYADLMDFINETCDIQGTPRKGLTNSGHEKFSQPYKLRLAVILFVMAAIEAEYPSSWIWKPEHSQLYSLTQAIMKEIFNITSTSEFDQNKLRGYLKSLFDYIEEDTFTYLKSSKSYTDEMEVLLKSVKENFDLLNDKILKQLTDLKSKPTPTVSANVGSTVKSVTKHGINTAMGKAISCVLFPDISKQVARSVGGSIGFLCFGPTGGLIGVCLADYANSSLVPIGMSYLFSSVISPIGSGVGALTKGFTFIMLYPAEKGLKYVFSHDPEVRKKQEECINNNQEFIEALLKLPENIISKNKKEILQQYNSKNFIGH